MSEPPPNANPSSRPAPTESTTTPHPSQDPTTATTTMRPSPSSSLPPLTLIVALATSPPLGIGRAGTLPWPMLKTDMSFFARVTRRVPREPHPHRPATQPPSSSSQPSSSAAADGRGKINALLMGRKTYASVPAHLRPLSGRLNIVISRQDPTELQNTLQRDVATLRAKRREQGKKDLAGEEEDVLVVGGMEGALELLKGLWDGGNGRLGGVFVIGGAEVYRLALQGKRELDVRAVVTQLRRRDGDGFECDTFFPMDFDREGTWRAVEKAEVEEWVGEEVLGEWTEEGDTGIEMRMVGFQKKGRLDL